MSSTIVNTMIGFGLDIDEAATVAGEVSFMLDQTRTKMNKLSREIEDLVQEFNRLETRAKAMEAALADDQHDSAEVVPLHGKV